MKSKATKTELLKHLQKMPIIQIACERANVSRATYYRWRKEDKEFKTASNAAILEGAILISDLAESQLISGIRDKQLGSIVFWLKHNHPKYANRLEVKHAVQDESLTPEQEELVKKALHLASLATESKEELVDSNEHTNELKTNTNQKNGEENQQ